MFSVWGFGGRVNLKFLGAGRGRPWLGGPGLVGGIGVLGGRGHLLSMIGGLGQVGYGMMGLGAEPGFMMRFSPSPGPSRWEGNWVVFRLIGGSRG